MITEREARICPDITVRLRRHTFSDYVNYIGFSRGDIAQLAKGARTSKKKVARDIRKYRNICIYRYSGETGNMIRLHRRIFRLGKSYCDKTMIGIPHGGRRG